MSVRITKQRLRITFGKQGSLRFIGHLDTAKMWERILRRAQLPVEYTQGFNRRPRTQFADALSLGLTSEAELVDVWLVEEVEINDGLIAQIAAVSPADLKIYQINAVEITDPSLPTLVKSATYRLEAVPPATFPHDLAERLQNLLAAESLIRQRSKKTYDLRPLIYALEMIDASTFRAELALGEGTTGRPHELLDALSLSDFPVRIHRETLQLKSDV